MALRERRLAREVVGIGRNKANLAKAQQLGAVDRFATEIAEGVANADLVVVCTPVDTIAEFVRQIGAACRKDALITDAGSTKEEIVSAVDRLTSNQKSGPHFVGSHPLAGDHRTGVEVARADLLVGRKVIVTPTAKSDTGRRGKVDRILAEFGRGSADHDSGSPRRRFGSDEPFAAFGRVCALCRDTARFAPLGGERLAGYNADCRRRPCNVATDFRRKP